MIGNFQYVYMNIYKRWIGMHSLYKYINPQLTKNIKLEHKEYTMLEEL